MRSSPTNDTRRSTAAEPYWPKLEGAETQASSKRASSFLLMKRCQRMKHGREFARLRREGRSRTGKYLLLSALNDVTGTGDSAFLAGIITSKKVGMAVVRNRIRRRLRAIIGEFAGRIVPGTMMVVIARYCASEATYQMLRADWKRLAERAGILTKLTSPAPS